MKTLTFILHLGILIAGALASAASMESTMSGFNLKTCSADQKKCLIVKADNTLGSQMKNLHALTKPEVTFTIRKTGKTEVLKGDSGYIDFDEKQVVLYSKENGKLIETSINISSFAKNRMVVGTNL